MGTISEIGFELQKLWHRSRFFADVPMVLNVLRYRKIRREFYQNLWKQAALKTGASYEVTPHGFIRISHGNHATFVQDGSVMLDSHLALEVMGNKAITLDLLREIGAPTPESCEYSLSDLAPAEALLGQFGSIVVKPKRGTGGGRGVTTGVTDSARLVAASKLAARSGPKLIAEAQLETPCFRLLYLDGKFLDIVRRDPPVITGDGASSIRTLVRVENEKRRIASPVTALSPLNIDRDMKNYLSERSIGLSHVPKAGERLQVKRSINENDASRNVNVKESISDDIRDNCGKIAEALSVQLAGIDLYCNDISGLFGNGNCVVGEVNTTPGLHHHYLISEPEKCTDVAALILEYMFESGTGTLKLGRINSPTRRGKGKIKSPKQLHKDNLCDA